MKLVSAAIVGLVVLQGRAAEAPADLIVTGRVWTAETGNPWAEAVAIRDGRIAFVGSAQQAAAFSGPKTQKVAAGARLVLPGFNDAHVHMVSGALSLERVDVIEDLTLAAVQARIKAFAAAHPANEWVVGRGWLYGSFPGGLPTKQQLDAVVPDRPAYIECYDGHSGWANSKALALAGITKDTKDPKNGVIVRDPATGEPTGALKEAASGLVDAKIPLPGPEGQYQLLLKAMQYLNSLGITSAQDAALEPKDVPLFERAEREGRLSVRLQMSPVMGQDDYPKVVAETQELTQKYNSALLRFGSVKGFVDGVIEAHTAAMLAPYSDDASFGLGLPNWRPEELDKAVIAADAAGLQVRLHAIGDRGVRMALDAHEAALKANGRNDRRGRIEHIETIDAADYPRFKQLGVVASMQPLHANPDQNNFEVWSRNIGLDRSGRGFSWAAIEKAGGRLVFGSDWPVVTPDVFRGLYCAVTRKTREGTPAGGWHPELAVSLESALRHYTIDAAYMSFEDGEKGSLAVGKRADLAVLSEDLFKTTPETILKTKVLLTLLEGRVVYRAPGF